jgi:type II protein arginine methyltransferase
MNIGATLPPEEPATIFYIGHHETQRTEAVRDEHLAEAENLGYDFVTTPITTPKFQSRVVDLVSQHYHSLRNIDNGSKLPLPLVPSLTPEDTVLAPAETNTSRIAFASSWIDLGSTDPVIAHVSRQVFNAEVAYAAFCGVNNVVVPGPVEGSDVVQYARAIHEALGLGPYLQLHILLPMYGELETESDTGTHLSTFASPDGAGEDNGNTEYDDLYYSWETWDTIRTLCVYSQKLSLGMILHPCFSLSLAYLSAFPTFHHRAHNT